MSTKSALYLIYIYCFVLIFLNFGCSKTKNGVGLVKVDSLPLISNQPAANLLPYRFDNIYVKRHWQGIPSIEIYGQKHLVASWYSGAFGEGAGNYVTVADSKDGGLSWNKNTLIVAPPDSSYRAFDPSLWKDNNGELHLFWSQSKGLWDGKGGVWTALLSFNKNDKIQFSKPEPLTNGVMINKPVYSSRTKSQIIMPITVWNEKPTDPRTSAVFVAFSRYSDASRKFTFTSRTVTIPLDNNIREYDEPQIVALNNGKYLCLLRTKKGVFYSKSDNATTWSKPTPFTAVAPNAVSRFHIQRLTSGNILLILNASHIRDNLKAYLSQDDGETWSHSLLIDSRANVSYPDACEGPNQQLYIIYDRNRQSDKEIILARFNEKDFFSNEARIERSIIDK